MQLNMLIPVGEFAMLGCCIGVLDDFLNHILRPQIRRFFLARYTRLSEKTKGIDPPYQRILYGGKIHMMDKNPQALALAFKKCKGKILKIKELAITPEMDEDAIEALIEQLAVAKAAEDDSAMSDHVKGQRWYVEGLVKFSALEPEDQLEQEYNDAFADNASEDEMHQALKAMAA